MTNYLWFLNEELDKNLADIDKANNSIDKILQYAKWSRESMLVLDVIHDRVVVYTGSPYLIANIKVLPGITTIGRLLYHLECVSKDLLQAAIQHIKNVTINEIISEISLRVNLCVKNENIKRVVQCRVSIIENSEDGKPWLVLCRIANPVKLNLFCIYLHFSEAEKMTVYKYTGKDFVRISNNEFCYSKDILNDKEKDVISLCARGMTTKEIASVLNLSIDAIKSRKNNILSKLYASNITEAVCISLYYNLI